MSKKKRNNKEYSCPECKGTGIFGGPGSWYDTPGRGKPCDYCDGTGYASDEDDFQHMWEDK